MLTKVNIVKCLIANLKKNLNILACSKLWQALQITKTSKYDKKRTYHFTKIYPNFFKCLIIDSTKIAAAETTPVSIILFQLTSSINVRPEEVYFSSWEDIKMYTLCRRFIKRVKTFLCCYISMPTTLNKIFGKN